MRLNSYRSEISSVTDNSNSWYPVSCDFEAIKFVANPLAFEMHRVHITISSGLFPHYRLTGKFLDEWCRQTMRSRIEPMKKIARSLRQHRELILNYFRAQKLISSGVVEGLNNKAKVTMRKSYGFRTYRVLELALYHSLGKLPEPESTHDFF
jgi:hypothetical protein